MKVNLIHTTRDRAATCPNFAFLPPHFNPDHTVYSRKYGRIFLRPIRIDDEARMVTFHQGLSEESVYLRYFEHISLDTRTLHERLARVCANTADSFAIVAERHGSASHSTQILGVGRLTTTDEPDTASFATLIADEAINTNLPQEMVARLITIARAYRFRHLTGELLVADSEGLAVCRRLNFNLHTVAEDGIVRVSLRL